MHTAAKPMLDKCDEVSPKPAQEVTRDSMPENVTRDRMSLRVSDHLLDLMAADDESRHLAALKSLEDFLVHLSLMLEDRVYSLISVPFTLLLL